MVYQYNPCDPCCGGCGYFDPFDVFTGWITTRDAFTTTGGNLLLEDDVARAYRDVRRVDDEGNLTPFTVSSRIVIPSEKTGIFISGLYAAWFDESWKAWVATCDATGQITGTPQQIGTIASSFYDFINLAVTVKQNGQVTVSAYTTTVGGHRNGIIVTSGQVWGFSGEPNVRIGMIGDARGSECKWSEISVRCVGYAGCSGCGGLMPFEYEVQVSGVTANNPVFGTCQTGHTCTVANGTHRLQYDFGNTGPANCRWFTFHADTSIFYAELNFYVNGAYFQQAVGGVVYRIYSYASIFIPSCQSAASFWWTQGEACHPTMRYDLAATISIPGNKRCIFPDHVMVSRIQ